MIYIKIEDKIDANALIQKIQKLISSSDISSDSFLEIKIVNVTYDHSTIIPKLEQKELKSCLTDDDKCDIL